MINQADSINRALAIELHIVGSTFALIHDTVLCMPSVQEGGRERLGHETSGQSSTTKDLRID